MIQIVGGITAFAAPQEAGGIAWWAHIGGFLAGLALIRPVGAPRRTARRLGPSRGRVREIGVQRVGVMRVGPQRRRLKRIGAAAPERRRTSIFSRPRAPAQRASASVTDTAGEIDRSTLAYRLGDATTRVLSSLDKSGSEATERTRRGPWE